tara:strand:+ start:937 stop:1392 length:456 start_codon:yes stop_codon:yes gene_type:complete
MANELTSITHPVAVEINNRKRLLTKLIEPINQRLLAVSIADPVAQEEATSVGGISGVQPLKIKPESDVFRLSFVDFVSYAVTEEMYAQSSDEQVSEGEWLRIYSKSFFLDFVSKTTWATSEFPGPLVHFQINTLDHTIDIVTSKPPEIVRV